MVHIVVQEVAEQIVATTTLRSFSEVMELLHAGMAMHLASRAKVHMWRIADENAHADAGAHAQGCSPCSSRRGDEDDKRKHRTDIFDSGSSRSATRVHSAGIMNTFILRRIRSHHGPHCCAGSSRTDWGHDCASLFFPR